MSAQSTPRGYKDEDGNFRLPQALEWDFCVVLGDGDGDEHRSNSANSNGAAPFGQFAEELCARFVRAGLQLGVVEKNGSTAHRLILLLRAPAPLVQKEFHELQRKRWLSSGAGLKMDIGEDSDDENDGLATIAQSHTVADRVQCIASILARSMAEGGCGLHDLEHLHEGYHSGDRRLMAVFPLKDNVWGKAFIKRWMRNGGFIGLVRAVARWIKEPGLGLGQLFQQVQSANDVYIEEIRVHYGERVALYFAFTSLYTTVLWALALLLTSLKVVSVFVAWEFYLRALGVAGLAVPSIWAPIFAVAWKRRSSRLMLNWGMLKAEEPKWNKSPYWDPTVKVNDAWWWMYYVLQMAMNTVIVTGALIIGSIGVVVWFKIITTPMCAEQFRQTVTDGSCVPFEMKAANEAVHNQPSWQVCAVNEQSCGRKSRDFSTVATAEKDTSHLDWRFTIGRFDQTDARTPNAWSGAGEDNQKNAEGKPMKEETYSKVLLDRFDFCDTVEKRTLGGRMGGHQCAFPFYFGVDSRGQRVRHTECATAPAELKRENAKNSHKQVTFCVLKNQQHDEFGEVVNGTVFLKGNASNAGNETAFQMADGTKYDFCDQIEACSLFTTCSDCASSATLSAPEWKVLADLTQSRAGAGAAASPARRRMLDAFSERRRLRAGKKKSPPPAKAGKASWSKQAADKAAARQRNEADKKREIEAAGLIYSSAQCGWCESGGPEGAGVCSSSCPAIGAGTCGGWADMEHITSCAQEFAQVLSRQGPCWENATFTSALPPERCTPACAFKWTDFWHHCKGVLESIVAPDPKTLKEVKVFNAQCESTFDATFKLLHDKRSLFSRCESCVRREHTKIVVLAHETDTWVARQIKAGALEAGLLLGVQVEVRAAASVSAYMALLDAAAAEDIDGYVVTLSTNGAKKYVDKLMYHGDGHHRNVAFVHQPLGATLALNASAMHLSVLQDEASASARVAKDVKAAAATRVLCVDEDTTDSDTGFRCKTIDAALKKVGLFSKILSVKGSSSARDAAIKAEVTASSINAVVATDAPGAATATSLGLITAVYDASEATMALLDAKKVLLAVDEQPFMQGFLSTMLLVLEHTTNDHLVGHGASSSVRSGPRFHTSRPATAGLRHPSQLNISMVLHAETQQNDYWNSVFNGTEQAQLDMGLSRLSLFDKSLAEFRDPATSIDPLKIDTAMQKAFLKASSAFLPSVDGLLVSIPDQSADMTKEISHWSSKGAAVVSITAGQKVSAKVGSGVHIGQDQRNAGYKAAQRMINDGAKTGLCLQGDVDWADDAHNAQCSGFVQAFSDAKSNASKVEITHNTWLNTQRIGSVLLKKFDAVHDHIDAVFCTSSSYGQEAVDVVDYAQRQNPVKKDRSNRIRVAMAGFDVGGRAFAARALLAKKLDFVVHEQPFLQGYLGVVALVLKLWKGIDLMPDGQQGSLLSTGPAMVDLGSISKAGKHHASRLCEMRPLCASSDVRTDETIKIGSNNGSLSYAGPSLTGAGLTAGVALKVVDAGDACSKIDTKGFDFVVLANASGCLLSTKAKYAKAAGAKALIVRQPTGKAIWAEGSPYPAGAFGPVAQLSVPSAPPLLTSGDYGLPVVTAYADTFPLSGGSTMTPQLPDAPPPPPMTYIRTKDNCTCAEKYMLSQTEVCFADDSMLGVTWKTVAKTAFPILVTLLLIVLGGAVSDATHTGISRLYNTELQTDYEDTLVMRAFTSRWVVEFSWYVIIGVFIVPFGVQIIAMMGEVQCSFFPTSNCPLPTKITRSGEQLDWLPYKITAAVRGELQLNKMIYTPMIVLQIVFAVLDTLLPYVSYRSKMAAARLQKKMRATRAEAHDRLTQIIDDDGDGKISAMEALASLKKHAEHTPKPRVRRHSNRVAPEPLPVASSAGDLTAASYKDTVMHIPAVRCCLCLLLVLTRPWFDSFCVHRRYPLMPPMLPLTSHCAGACG